MLTVSQAVSRVCMNIQELGYLSDNDNRFHSMATPHRRPQHASPRVDGANQPPTTGSPDTTESVRAIITCGSAVLCAACNDMRPNTEQTVAAVTGGTGSNIGQVTGYRN